MREQRTQTVEFSLVDPLGGPQNVHDQGFTGTLIDISASGIGFTTDVPLEPGNRILLGNIMKGNSGVVMWTVQMERTYRVGVRFTEGEYASS